MMPASVSRTSGVPAPLKSARTICDLERGRGRGRCRECIPSSTHCELSVCATIALGLFPYSLACMHSLSLSPSLPLSLSLPLPLPLSLPLPLPLSLILTCTCQPHLLAGPSSWSSTCSPLPGQSGGSLPRSPPSRLSSCAESRRHSRHCDCLELSYAANAVHPPRETHWELYGQRVQYIH